MPSAERYAHEKSARRRPGLDASQRASNPAQRHSPGISRRQAAGHPGPGEVPVSGIGRRWTELPRQPVTTGSREGGRMARLSGDIGRLKGGDLSPNTFDRRWDGKHIGIYEVPTASEALAHAHARGPSPDRPYRRLSTRTSR